MADSCLTGTNFKASLRFKAKLIVSELKLKWYKVNVYIHGLNVTILAQTELGAITREYGMQEH